jgi:hypothetical protein
MKSDDTVFLIRFYFEYGRKEEEGREDISC